MNKLNINRKSLNKTKQENKQAVIQLGKDAIIQNQLKKHSLLTLFRSTLKFIPFHIWLSQIILVICILLLRDFQGTLLSPNTIIKYLTFAVLLSVLFFIDELFKSFINGVWELERTLKYDLRQLTIMKLLIFGISDALIIFLFSWFYKPLIMLPFYHILLFLFVPYNLICILLLVILTFGRHLISNLFLWTGTGVLVSLILFIINAFDIYHLKIIYWASAYGISSLILAAIIYIQLKNNYLEAI